MNPKEMLVPVCAVITTQQIETLFKREKIVAQCREVNEAGKQYYQSMLAEVEKANEGNFMAKKILASRIVRENDIAYIKSCIIDKAVQYQLVANQDVTLEDAIVLTLTEENVKEAVDKLKESTMGSINEFCNKLVDGFMD